MGHGRSGRDGQAGQINKVAATAAALRPTEGRLIKAVVSFTPFTALNSGSLFTALDELWEIGGPKRKSRKGDSQRQRS